MKRCVLGAFATMLLAAACGSSGGHTAAPAPSTTTAPATTTSTTRPQHGGGTQTVALEATSGVSPAQLARAERLLNTTIADLPTWNTTAKAQAAGYRSIGDSLTGDEHYVNWSYVDDGRILDPTHPESLVYEQRNGHQQVVAAMFM